MTYEEALKYIHSVNWVGSKLGPLQTQLAAHPVAGAEVLERFFIGHMVLPDF